jgi:hypothetical protein
MDIVHPAHIQIYGAPGMGKSYLLRYLAYVFLCEKYFDYMIICTGSKFDGGYQYLDQDFVVEKDIPAVVEQIMEQQRSNHKLKVVVYFDDLTGTINWNNAKFTELATVFRHFNATVCIGCHYPFKISPTVREAAQYAAIFYQQGKRSMNAVYESFAQEFPEQEGLKQYITKFCGKNHVFIWYTKSPSEGIKRFQPMKCPENIPDFNISFNWENDPDNKLNADKEGEKKKTRDNPFTSAEESKKRKKEEELSGSSAKGKNSEIRIGSKKFKFSIAE